MYQLSTAGGKDMGEMQLAVIWSPIWYLESTPRILGPELGRSETNKIFIYLSFL
jgi:hypothetical protein